MKSKSSTATTTVQHYNDWPNAIGFDTAYAEREPVELTVQGNIPGYAAGTLFRTSAGLRTITNDKGKELFKVNHWFDGFSEVHRFQLHAPPNPLDSNARINKVTYNSRFTSDKLITRIQETGKISDFSFAAKYEPCKSFFKKLQGAFAKAPELAPNEINNAVTLTVNYPGLSAKGTSQPSPHDSSQMVTLCNKTDAARLQLLDPTTLEPTGIANQSVLDPELKGVLSAAHPETCPITGDIYNYNMDFTAPKATYQVFRTQAATGKTSVLATIHAPCAYLHSMFLTENFMVLCIWNSHFAKYGASILWQNNLLESMYMNDSEPAMWYVIDRRCPKTEGGKGIVAKFESDPYFAFHSVNAYEKPSEQGKDTVDLVCDIVTYKNMDILNCFYMDMMTSSNPKAHEVGNGAKQGRYDNAKAHLRRYTLPNVPLPNSSSSSSSSTSKAITTFTMPPSQTPELPVINPHYNTKLYRYTYGVQFFDGFKSSFVDGLIKFDNVSQSSITWSQHGHTPGEPIFIPNPEAKSEDDGVLLVVVLDGMSERSYLLCLDARDLKEVGKVLVNGPVGFGFHGTWSGVGPNVVLDSSSN